MLAFCATCALSGCGGDDAVHTVSGKITYQGDAVTSGLINFKPKEGRPLGGGIGSDGTYQFELPEGKYEVRIDTPPPMPKDWKEGDPPPKAGKRQVPQKYGLFGSSGLSATITADEATHAIDFALP